MNQTIQQIDRDRRRRERELALLMLLLAMQVRRYAAHAIRLDTDPLAAMRLVWLGGEHFRGITTPLARAMADAHLGGFTEAARLSGSTAGAIDAKLLAKLYEPLAEQAAVQMLGTMQEKVATAQIGVYDSKLRIQNLRTAFEEYGYYKADPWAIKRAAEANVVGAYSRGMADGYRGGSHTGYKHFSILDDGTTEICFSGSTRITPIGRVSRVFRRFYKGEMLIIRTAAGREMKVTPNHPILTARGWLPATELQPQQEIIYTVGREGFCSVCANDVGMPATFSQIADAAFHPSVSDVQVKRAATADFHGDGNRGDGYIDIAVIKRHLMIGDVAIVFQNIIHQLFAWVDLGYRAGADFLCDTGISPHFVAGLLSNMPSENCPALSQCAENPMATSFQSSLNFNGANSLRMHIHRLLKVGFGLFASAPSGNMWHDSELAKIVGNSGGRSVELPCQRCGGTSVTIKPDDVVEVRREFAAEHVYNLQSDRGVYIADGAVVKNCNERDGLTLPKDDLYWLHNYPPLHFGCRSVILPVRGAQQWSTDLPKIPPAQGWGFWPQWLGPIEQYPQAA